MELTFKLMASFRDVVLLRRAVLICVLKLLRRVFSAISVESVLTCPYTNAVVLVVVPRMVLLVCVVSAVAVLAEANMIAVESVEEEAFSDVCTAAISA